ncbi:hypothetical protein B0T25DRAFT_560364 [Lasiosphaeria hispida]|uniref:DUF1398 domain-containing protein n=1 Tax=Lasiosphaeria hispida TaxID=260671 RepID=A0AAJ0H509_9PEZI|nr:hypothetical protein B0T25DRAFT_560364 [Lasiosphaeria hispida]
MQPTTSAAIRAVWEKVHSLKGFPFPATVAALTELGVTRYRADYTAATVTAYLDDTGESYVSPLTVQNAGTAGKKWDLAGLQKAIQGAQTGAIGNYHDFSAAAVVAGVVDYTCFISGKKVVYNGALGDSHAEWFPGVKD